MITDEMVEAFGMTFFGVNPITNTERSKEDIRAALEAAFAAMPKPEPVARADVLEILCKISPDVEIVALTDPEYGDVTDLHMSASQLIGVLTSATPAPDVSVKAEQHINVIIDAWEALPGGRQVAVNDVEEWLAEDMAPAINAARAFMARDKPDGAANSIHPDDLAVDRFASAMKAKLAKKRAEGRGGWDDSNKAIGVLLSKLLREHVEKGDPLDVGNLAMMLHQRGDRILSSLNTSPEAPRHD